MLDTCDQAGLCALDYSDNAGRLAAAMQAPHFHLRETEAVELLALAGRVELIDWAVAATKLVQMRDGQAGHELPNRNALMVACAALFLLLNRGPALAAERGAA